MRSLLHVIVALGLSVLAAACGSAPTDPSPTPTEMSGPTPPAPAPMPEPVPTPTPRPGAGITSDSDLFAFVTQTQPFSTYALFPNLNADAEGILAASSAHQPLIRVSLNATAAGALKDGRLPRGTAFPDGSVILKEVLTGRTPTVYAIMYRDRNNANAGNGWLWAEIRPSGSVEYSIARRGAACAGCHSLGDGPQNDLVRIFERQR